MRLATGIAVAAATSDVWIGAAVWFGLVAIENILTRVVPQPLPVIEDEVHPSPTALSQFRPKGQG